MPTLSVRCHTYALHLTHTASWPPTRSGELFNCKHPDYRPVYTERVVRLARIRTPSGSCQPCAANCLKLPFTTGSSGSIRPADVLSASEGLDDEHRCAAMAAHERGRS